MPVINYSHVNNRGTTCIKGTKRINWKTLRRACAAMDNIKILENVFSKSFFVYIWTVMGIPMLESIHVSSTRWDGEIHGSKL